MLWQNRSALIFVGVVLSCATPSRAQQIAPNAATIDTSAQSPEAPAIVPAFATLYRFPGGSGVYFPRGGLTMDSAGNLYGTTRYGHEGTKCQGFDTCGAVYKLTAPKWTYTLLYSGVIFKQGIDPTAPLRVVGDTIYGVMSGGGDPACGCGVVFTISTTGAGYKEFHVFGPNFPAKQVHGATPIGGLLIDGDMMYGTTEAGGDYGSGVIYSLSTAGSDFKVLHHFAAYQGQQTSGPQGELLLGKDGFIYGTQFGGGKYNQGTVFRISKTGADFEVLYNFKGVNQPGDSTDGANPEGRLAQGSDGAIYGTTTFGGTPTGYGTAWSLKLSAGKWVYKQLRRFVATANNDANLPHSGLVIDTNGVLYGAGAGGGLYQSGAVYALTPPATTGAAWGYKTLRSFKELDANGDTPYGVLLLHNHLLYGMDLAGGDFTAACNALVNDGCGTVFRINP